MIYKTCPVCEQRKPRRECPALGRTICAVCCGTKRQIEINCPPDCAYLSTARAHPAAVVQRRRERDARFVVPLIQDLGERQYRLLLAFQGAILRHAGAAVPSPVDADVQDAAATLASTLETARKGIIYEHQTSSLPAQRLAGELRGLLAQLEREANARNLDRDAAVVLRAIEQGARTAAGAFPEDAPRAYLSLAGRMMSELSAREDAGPSAETSGLIIPG